MVIHINSIFKTLRKETCLALPGFHVLRHKISMGFMEIISRGTCPYQQLSQKLGRHTRVLSDKTADLEKVNNLRKDFQLQKMSVNAKYPSHTGCTSYDLLELHGVFFVTDDTKLATLNSFPFLRCFAWAFKQLPILWAVISSKAHFLFAILGLIDKIIFSGVLGANTMLTSKSLFFKTLRKLNTT